MPLNSTESRAPAARVDEPHHGQPGRVRNSLWANLLLSIVSTAVLFLVVEGLASVLMSTLAAKRTAYMREESHSKYDPDLGWSHRANLHIDDMYGENTRFTTNAQGFRANENFDKIVPTAKYRIIALGDSFTMGYGVGDESSYPAQMQARCPALQTVNMGMGGYGVDQNYLWYKRDGVEFDTNVLLFAVIAQDFYRMMDDQFIGYGKPVLRERNNALVVENVPVPPTWGSRTRIRRARAFLDAMAVVRTGRWLAGKIGRPKVDQFYGVVSNRVFAAAELAFNDLAQLSESRGQRFVIAYLPVRDLLAWGEPSREAAWMEDYARRNGVPFINLVADFERLTPAQIARLFRDQDYHYSREGNRFVAESLLRRLAEMIPGFPACVSPASSRTELRGADGR
jgi:lysophospholipase L1-like esterase